MPTCEPLSGQYQRHNRYAHAAVKRQQYCRATSATLPPMDGLVIVPFQQLPGDKQ
jgi:hypothetical protein